MNKEKVKAIIEWTIVVVLFSIFITDFLNSNHFTPLSAHKFSEQTFHYGPSKIVEEYDLDEIYVFLGRYKDWYSASVVQKEYGFFWDLRGGATGGEIEEDQDVSYRWSSSRIHDDLMFSRIYGVVTNPKITEIEIVLENSEDESDKRTMSYQLKEDHNMFFMHWNDDGVDYDLNRINGLNEDGKVLFEENWDFGE